MMTKEQIEQRLGEIKIKLHATSTQIRELRSQKSTTKTFCDSKERQKLNQELSRVLSLRESLKSEQVLLIASLREVSDSSSSSLTV